MANSNTVRSLPTLAPSAWLRRGAAALPEQLAGDGMSFWFSGRIAIYHATSALGLGPGQAVALPTFCCGSELDPLLAAGLEPRFYRLTPRLDPEPQSFLAALEGSAAAFITHYFGFPADLEEIRSQCRSHGVPLIEDCAHGLYSSVEKTPLGLRADAAIFSLAKTLPIPDGGALRLRCASKAPLPPAQPPPAKLVAQRTRSLLMRHFQSHPMGAISALAHAPHAAKRALGLVPAKADTPNPDALARTILFDPEMACVGMSKRALALVRRTAHEEVVKARRSNYATLLPIVQAMADVHPVFDDLRDGTCPLALPIVVDDPAQFQQRIAAEGGLGVKLMWPWFHPAVPWQDFEFEARLKRSLFILPVHQCLTSRELEGLATSLGRLATQDGSRM